MFDLVSAWARNLARPPEQAHWRGPVETEPDTKKDWFFRHVAESTELMYNCGLS